MKDPLLSYILFLRDAGSSLYRIPINRNKGELERINLGNKEF